MFYQAARAALRATLVAFCPCVAVWILPEGPRVCDAARFTDVHVSVPVVCVCVAGYVRVKALVTLLTLPSLHQSLVLPIVAHVAVQVCVMLWAACLGTLP